MTQHLNRSAALLVLLLALLLVAVGCETINRTNCQETVEKAKNAVLVCMMIDVSDGDINRHRCLVGAEIMLKAAELGCTFADEAEDLEAE